MFFLLQEAAANTQAAEQVPEQVEQAPIIVNLVNHYFGEWAYNFEMHYTHPVWKSFLAYFGSTPEDAFGQYTPEHTIPWYTIMFVIACILTVTLLSALNSHLSQLNPSVP